MKLLDKIKNIFTEEVDEDEEEVKVEHIKKEVRSVPIESPTGEKKEKKKVEKIEKQVQDIFADDEPVDTKKEEKKSAPVFFTERDFEDLIEPKRRVDKYEKKERFVEEKKKEEEKPRPYSGNYTNTTIIKKEKVTFKPTPIISPVYGVLDKNYHKEDIVDRKDTGYEAADGLSVDSIRNKAYGTLEDDIEEVMTSEPVKKKIEIEEEVDLFDELDVTEAETKTEVAKKEIKEKGVKEIEDATIDLTKELDNLLLSKEKYSMAKEELEEEKDKDKDNSLSENDLFNLIDSMYEEGEED